MLHLQNLNLVRLFISYHLHIYRLVSVAHRINAAFGVSQKFVPYRKGYASVYDSHTFNTSNSYTLDSKGVGHILTISSFAHFYIGYVIQYTNEDYLRIIEIFKTTDFDNVATISSSSNVLTITAASSAHWLVTNLIKLGS